MNVLVCDDDRATRFAVKRILTQAFGFTITECGDGLEALQALSAGSFQLLLLDVEMPTMSGIEVLELLRDAEATKDLPVVVLSNVREQDAIQYLLKLGVSDYIVKPPRTDTLVSKIQRLLKVMPQAKPAARVGASIRLSKDSGGLVVDGSLVFRGLLLNELQPFGPILEAESGAAAVARFRDVPTGLVFVGQELGVVGPEQLVKRLRQLATDAGVCIVGMVDKPGSSTDALFDAVIQRSFVPALLRTALQPFVVIPGPLGALMAIVPDLMELAASAACQTVGMMFDADVVSAPATGTPQTVASARIDVELADHIGATIGVFLPADVATLVAQKMGGPETGDITDEARTSAAGELCKLFVGRVEANLRERKLTAACSQAVTSGTATFEIPPPDVGQAVRLAVPGAGDVFVVVTVSEPVGAPQSAPAPATADVEETLAATPA